MRRGGRARLDGGRGGRPRARRRGGCRRRDHERSAHGLRGGRAAVTIRSPSPTRPPGYTLAAMRRLALAAVLPCSVRRFSVAFLAARSRRRTRRRPDHDRAAHDDRAGDDRPTPAAPAGPKLIQPGVTIGGLLVGGLTAAEARELVEERFNKPISLVVSGCQKIRAMPEDLGATAVFPKAVKLAVRVRQPDSRCRSAWTSRTAKLQRSSPRLRRRPIASRSTRSSRCAASSRSRTKSKPGPPPRCR